MTILWLIALPLLAAVLVFLLRDLRLLSVVISAAVLAAMAVLLASWSHFEPLILLGRSISLSTEESVALVFCCSILALSMLHAYWDKPKELTYPLTLTSVALFVAATMIRNLIIAALLLQIGTAVAVMLIPSERSGSAMAGIRVLVLLTLSSFWLLIAAWTIDRYAANPEGGLLPGLSALALGAGLALGLGIAPFYVWQTAVFRDGSAAAVNVLTVAMGAVLLLRLDSMLGMASGLGVQDFLGMLLIGGGMLTIVAGALFAIPQRSVSRALAYMALGDLGMVLVGLGIGTQQSISAAAFHLAHRGLAILLASISLAVLRQSLGSEDLEDLWGAARRVPWAVTGVIVGGLSLAGMPLTAGFATRLLLYRAVVATSAEWVIPMTISMMGPLWFLLRFLRATLTSAPLGVGQRQRLGSKLLVIALSLFLLLLGVWPGLWSMLLGPVRLNFFQSLARLP